MKTSLTTIISTTLLLSELVGLAPRAHAQGGVPLWTDYYNGPTTVAFNL